jgi:SAM-dependent methyltransferase
MTVTRKNVHEMEEIVDFAAHRGISNIHFLWLFKKGNAAETNLFAPPDRIFENLKAAQERAETLGVRIDNMETIRSQVFSYPGTRHDLSNAGWQSLAVGPDGRVYPTPALVYTESMACGHMGDGLATVWKESPVLDQVRDASLNQSDAYGKNPFRYLIGGGDIDHSFIHSGRLTGGDPYVALYTNIAKWLIVRESKNGKTNGYEAIRLKMGEKLGTCPVEGSTIFFTHSNCVLSLPGNDTHTQVNRFYTEAAQDIKEDILNPVCYDPALMAHIPKEMQVRSYGCGSPVLEAGIRQGEAVVDLGSGTGIECFMAARLTGPRGRVVGIDMGDTMLKLAEKARESVVENLRYDNITFKKAFLEDLPLEDRSMDVVISNCVINLSPDKRRVFQEIFRVLRPGGRMVISDITYEGDIPMDIKYNETLRGECIGGALGYYDLFGLLNDVGFSHGQIIKGYPYRTVRGYPFHSITYQAVKPHEGTPPVLYDFPDFESVMAAVESEPTCACFTPRNRSPNCTPQPRKRTLAGVWSAESPSSILKRTATTRATTAVLPCRQTPFARPAISSATPATARRP